MCHRIRCVHDQHTTQFSDAPLQGTADENIMQADTRGPVGLQAAFSKNLTGFESMAVLWLIISHDGTQLWGHQKLHQSSLWLHQSPASPLALMSRCFISSCLRLDSPAVPAAHFRQAGDEEFPVGVNATFMSNWIGAASSFLWFIPLGQRIKGFGSEKIYWAGQFDLCLEIQGRVMSPEWSL